MTSQTELAATLREYLTGRHIKTVNQDGTKLTLDDGHVLTLYMSDQDCCASAHGAWVLKPDALDAVITDVNVVFDEARSGDDGDGTTNYVTITILHNQNPVALADCSANDGNGGYYFSVLSLQISHVIDARNDKQVDMTVVRA